MGGSWPAFFLIGLVLAFGIPSMTVRTAIMVPIAWALVQSLEIAPRSRGSALIMLTAIEMAVLPGCALLYGSLFGPAVESVFQTKHLPLSWLGYAKVMTVPTLILCGLVLAVNPLVMRPERRLKASPSFAKEKLRALGAISAEGSQSPSSRSPLFTGRPIASTTCPVSWSACLGWPHLRWPGLSEMTDIGGGVSWTLLLFIGGVFGLANMIQEYKITDGLPEASCR